MTLTASQAGSTLFPLIEAVNQDGGIVTITSKAGNAVLMSADEYAALEETAHLLTKRGRTTSTGSRQIVRRSNASIG